MGAHLSHSAVQNVRGAPAARRRVTRGVSECNSDRRISDEGICLWVAIGGLARGR